MLKFKSLVLQNYLSYGAIPTIIQLDRPGTTLLLGEDLDNTTNGKGANGVGKTALLNALVYAVYDTPISDIKLDNLINDVNKKNMMVAVEFDKDGHAYRIERYRKAKAGAAGNYTMLYIDGVDKTIAGSENVNAKILEIVGIPYDIFVRVVAFSAIHKPFLDLPTRSNTEANQTDIIEELFNLKILSRKADSLKAQIKETNRSLEAQQELIAQVNKETERYTKQLKTAKDRVDSWEMNRTNNLAQLRKQILDLQQIDVAEQKAIFAELEKLEENLEVVMTEKDHWDAISNESNKVIIEKKHELKHLDGGKCPYCKQGFEISQVKHDAITITLSSATAQQKEAAEHLKATNAVAKQLTTEYKRTKAKLAVRNLEELLQIDNNIKQLSEKLSDLQTATNPYNEGLAELEAIQIDAIDLTRTNALKKLLDHQNFLLKVLTKKDSFARKALLNKHIPYLNKRLQLYLAELGLPHAVEFTSEMAAKITRFGHEKDFGNLSNGQRARVNLALSFAFRDVLQSMHDHVNICVLDEVLDVGLDAIGVQAAAKMLKRKAREEKLALYIISHRDEIDSAFDRKMIVQMSGGFSSLRYEDE